MPKITFSHKYKKLQDKNGNIIKFAILLDVLVIDIGDFSPDFIKYDTENNLYSLPPSGKYLMLIFKKEYEHESDSHDLLTTLRGYTTMKEEYYCKQIGKKFDVFLFIGE